MSVTSAAVTCLYRENAGKSAWHLTARTFLVSEAFFQQALLEPRVYVKFVLIYIYVIIII